jgi:anti-sigma regulatory factor (Ser/Thr protein kinase)
MPTTGIVRPATLRVFRYVAASDDLRPIIGDEILPLSEVELIRRARQAMEERAFLVHTVPGPDADELCFVPYDGRCDILSIHSNGWRRFHGDHRRSLMQILNDLAAAVACGHLRLLDDAELEAELSSGRPETMRTISTAASLSAVRSLIAEALAAASFDEQRRQRTVLCASEAATNALVHGGGCGKVAVLRLTDRVRIVVADRGRGLNFLNWLQPGPAQFSMGYGYKIILDHVDGVCLHTGRSGTTLILDQLT